MAAGFVTVNFIDGGGTTRTGRFWSSDGTIGGLLYPAPVLGDQAGVNAATIKAASTPPVATDTSLVVAINPNSVNANGQAAAAASAPVVIASDQMGLRSTKLVQDTTLTTTVSETTIVTANATHALDLYGLILANSSATATTVTIKDSTGGTTRAVIQVPAGETRGFMLPMDSGIPQAAANNNWTATSSASITSLFVTALTRTV